MINKNEVSILIVDDSLEYRTMMEFILSSHYPNLFFASNGEEAFKILNKKKIDLVISDFEMPGTDGKWLLKKIQTNAIATSVIVVSGSILISEQEIIDLGAQALLRKPFSIKGFLQSIATQLSSL